MRIELISSGYKAEIMNHYTKPPFLKFHCNNRRKYKKCSEFYEVTLFFNKWNIVAQGGVEPPAMGYEPTMLPLHYRAMLFGGPWGSWSPDLNIMSVLLWPTELRAQTCCGLYGIRTRLIELRDRETSTPSRPRDQLKCGRGGIRTHDQ